MTTSKKAIRSAFWKLGCSGALFYTLNREFGHAKENEERATAPLCGGFMQTGHQCGMLWGAALGAGAEAFRRTNDQSKAIGMAITATQQILKSYLDKTKSHNCREVTGCNPSTVTGLLKYFVLGKPLSCMNLGVKWAPEAYQSAKEVIADKHKVINQPCISCATELAKKMGASNDEMIMVAGFAGGLGLSGNACGALAAAIWLQTLARCRKDESITSNREAKKTMAIFYTETNAEIKCQKITGQRFNTLDEHTQFMQNGGCAKLIDKLSQS